MVDRNDSRRAVVNPHRCVRLVTQDPVAECRDALLGEYDSGDLLVRVADLDLSATAEAAAVDCCFFIVRHLLVLYGLS